jgi:transposase
MRLTIDERRLIGKAIDRGVKKSSVADVLGITKRTVYKWYERRKHLKDRKRKPRGSKITLKVELSILALRNTMDWGTERIQKGLFSLPKFIKDAVGVAVEGITLSRTAINNVLKNS